MTTTAVRERPILFQGEMVRGVLDDRKTQARRLNGLDDVNESPNDWTFHQMGTLDYMTRKPYKGRFGAYFHSETLQPGTLLVCPVVCPYGQPGDRLWVRERHAREIDRVVYAADRAGVYFHPDNHERVESQVTPFYLMSDWQPRDRWRPSIHMPRWASRITLEVTDVRVERVQDITGNDVLAEGVPFPDVDKIAQLTERWRPFCTLWDSINGPRGYGWDANPWVWVVSFARATG